MKRVFVSSSLKTHRPATLPEHGTVKVLSMRHDTVRRMRGHLYGPGGTPFPPPGLRFFP
jgi:hypothetical protein